MPNEMRLIDANALKEKMWFLFKWFGQLPCSPMDIFTQQVIKKCIAEVDKIPTVDAVEVVHGRWKEGYVIHKYCCSCCGVRQDVISPYCPNCGAKMDGGNEDG